MLHFLLLAQPLPQTILLFSGHWFSAGRRVRGLEHRSRTADMSNTAGQDSGMESVGGVTACEARTPAHVNAKHLETETPHCCQERHADVRRCAAFAHLPLCLPAYLSALCCLLFLLLFFSSPLMTFTVFLFPAASAPTLISLCRSLKTDWEGWNNMRSWIIGYMA